MCDSFFEKRIRKDTCQGIVQAEWDCPLICDSFFEKRIRKDTCEEVVRQNGINWFSKKKSGEICLDKVRILGWNKGD